MSAQSFDAREATPRRGTFRRVSSLVAGATVAGVALIAGFPGGSASGAEAISVPPSGHAGESLTISGTCDLGEAGTYNVGVGIHLVEIGSYDPSTTTGTGDPTVRWFVSTDGAQNFSASVVVPADWTPGTNYKIGVQCAHFEGSPSIDTFRGGAATNWLDFEVLADEVETTTTSLATTTTTTTTAPALPGANAAQPVPRTPTYTG